MRRLTAQNLYRRGTTPGIVQCSLAEAGRDSCHHVEVGGYVFDTIASGVIAVRRMCLAGSLGDEDHCVCHRLIAGQHSTFYGPPRLSQGWTGQAVELPCQQVAKDVGLGRRLAGRYPKGSQKQQEDRRTRHESIIAQAR